MPRITAAWAFAFICFAARSEERPAPRFEVYQGFDYWGRGLDTYSSAVCGVGAPVTGEGFRLNFAGLAKVSGESSASVFANAFALRNTSGASQLLAGYQLHRGPVWIKFYAGGLYETGTKLAAASSQSAAGWSAKGAVETWWRVSDRVWTSADVSYTGANSEVSVYAKAASDVWRFDSGLILALGAETALDAAGSQSGGRQPSVRAGGLLNARFHGHDFYLSGGMAEATDGTLAPYATMTYGRKF